MNDHSAVPATRAPDFVLRRLHWVVYSAVLAAVLIPLYFEIPMTHGTLKSMAGGGVVGALVFGIMTAGFRCRIGPGMLTVTELYMRQSVDLNRLTSVSAPDRPERYWFSMLAGRRRWLELRDERGPVVRLNFFGIWRAPRQRLLAALEPYVMADGVSRTGLVTEALSGQLWWPRPRPS
jgi:hypothetical protein